MVNKKLMIKGQRGVLADIKSAVSIAFFDDEMSRFDGSIDENVKRAVTYNKVVIDNLIQRLFSIYSLAENDRESVKKKEIELKNILYGKFVCKEYNKLFYAKYDEKLLSFLQSICINNEKVKSYDKYVISLLLEHYFDYTKN